MDCDSRPTHKRPALLAHPLHFHLVNVQIISRQGKGAAVAPALYERGWKETVRMNPGEVTTGAVQAAHRTIPGSGEPQNRRL